MLNLNSSPAPMIENSKAGDSSIDKDEKSTIEKLDPKFSWLRRKLVYMKSRNKEARKGIVQTQEGAGKTYIKLLKR